MNNVVQDLGSCVKFDLKFFSTSAIRRGEVGKIMQQRSDHAERIWLFDCLYEGHGRPELEYLVDDLKTLPNFNSARYRFLVNVCDDLSHIPGRVISWPWSMVNHCEFFETLEQQDVNWADIQPDRKFIILIRRPSSGRFKLAKMVLDEFDEQDYYISLASGITYQASPPELDPYTIPIILDEPVTDSIKQHRARDLRFFSALINLVVETSSNEDSLSWSSLFITEKTFKCFAWHQIPIWFGVPGLVDRIRNLGFDVFDDWFNGHDYDNIIDPDLRRQRVMELLAQAIKDLDPVAARKSVYPRLQHNHDLLVSYNDRWRSYRDQVYKEIMS